MHLSCCSTCPLVAFMILFMDRQSAHVPILLQYLSIGSIHDIIYGQAVCTCTYPAAVPHNFSLTFIDSAVLIWTIEEDFVFLV